jgi:hypothetical protein
MSYEPTKYIAAVTPQRVTADGPTLYQQGTRDGAVFSADWLIARMMEGRVFCASAGTVTTPITWDATATIDVTKPILWVSVPATVAVIPLEITLYMEAFGTNAQFECNAQVGTGGSRTSGGTALTPTNLRSDKPVTSSCTVYGGDSSPVFVGSTTNVSEFWRDGQQFAITKTTASATAAASDPNKFVWRLKDSGYGPIGAGASQIAVHQGSQAGTGFCKMVWVEVPVTSIV